MRARIVGSGTYLPSKRLTNADLEKMVDTNDEWIFSRTGMRERRIAADDEFTSDMGIAAAKKAMDAAGVTPDQIDMIAVATTTPDYTFPSTAAVVQHGLGCKNAAAFDLQATCVGYLYGLSLAKGLVESGSHKNVLVIASEKISSIIDYTDRTTCILFGDGAAASVISAEGPGYSIEHVKLGADGEHVDMLYVPGGGCRMPFSEKCLSERQNFIRMEGRKVFKQAVLRMEESMESALKAVNLTQDQISWLVPHQANVRIIDAIARRFGVPSERIFLTIEKYGNTSASALPIALCECLEENTINEGEYILCPSFGAGMVWGTAVLKKL